VDYRDLAFVIGGPGHTGSTWLARAINAAPGVFVTSETNFLTWTFRTSTLADHFPPRERADGCVLGEHANTYFAFDEARDRLHGANPDIKVIFVVRDPVRKILSHYLHDLRWGIIPHYITLEIALLKEYFYYRYIDETSYTLHLTRWLDQFRPDQIYLYRSPADIGADAEHLSDLLRFLGVDRMGPLPGPVNERAFPLLPQVHRQARYASSRAVRALCRLVDPINVRLGRALGRKPYTDADLERIRNALGKHRDLEPLRDLATAHGIAGAPWLAR
jgi:hypothetical protein